MAILKYRNVSMIMYVLQRFPALRSGGFIAQKFNRRTVLEPCTKLSYEELNPPLRKTDVSGSGFLLVILNCFVYVVN